MSANYAKTMILHCSVLHYYLWKKDPVGQNSHLRPEMDILIIFENYGANHKVIFLLFIAIFGFIHAIKWQFEC